MVSVNHEDRHCNRQVFVHVIRLRVLVSFELCALLAKDCIIKQLLALVESLARWLVLVKEITPHYHEVQVGRVAGNFKCFLKPVKAIVCPHFVLLFITQVVIRSDHYVEDFAFVDSLGRLIRLDQSLGVLLFTNRLRLSFIRFFL